MNEIHEISEKLGTFEEKIESLEDSVQENSNQVGRLCTRFDRMERVEPEEFSRFKGMAWKHEWYWRGLFTIIGVAGFFLTIAWGQISQILR